MDGSRDSLSVKSEHAEVHFFFFWVVLLIGSVWAGGQRIGGEVGDGGRGEGREILFPMVTFCASVIIFSSCRTGSHGKVSGGVTRG